MIASWGITVLWYSQFWESRGSEKAKIPPGMTGAG